MNRVKHLFWGTVLSILVFFSVSFVTVLTHIGPWQRTPYGEPYNFDIGFPFAYYGQFWMRHSNSPNSGWTPKHLLYDCLLTWLVVMGVYVWVTKRKNNS